MCEQFDVQALYFRSFWCLHKAAFFGCLHNGSILWLAAQARVDRLCREEKADNSWRNGDRHRLPRLPTVVMKSQTATTAHRDHEVTDTDTKRQGPDYAFPNFQK